MGSAIKYDQDKPKVHLLEPTFLLGLAEVMTYGAIKYGEDNWKGGLDVTRMYSAAMRHLLAYRSGEQLDESGYSHVLHAAANLMMLHYYSVGEVGTSKVE